MKRVLIIHHWDTDGICSASLLRDELRQADVFNLVPTIGTYQISERILGEAAGDWDAIIIADIKLPHKDFRTLREVTAASILLFDHHMGETPDGVANLRSASEEIGPASHPSTTWLVKELLQLPISLRSLLGIVGDRGFMELSGGPAREDAMQFLSRLGLDERVLLKMTDLLDSNARVGEVSLVEEAVVELSKMGEDPKAILSHPIWTRNAEILEQEITRQMEMEDPSEWRDGVVVRELNSKFDIVSAVARKSAWSGKCRIAVAVNAGFLPDQAQIYVRRGTGWIDAPAIMRMAHERGYSAGGKEEVVGVVVPKDEAGIFLQELLSKLVS